MAKVLKQCGDGFVSSIKTGRSVWLRPVGKLLFNINGDGVGDLDEVYIESVIWKGEHNEIILESDERKWLMQSDQDEQVATYVPISFDFSKATFEVIEEENADED